MRSIPISAVRPFALAAALLGVACQEPSTLAVDPAAVSSSTPLPMERNADFLDFSHRDFFAPLPTSSVCSVGGGLEQFVLPTGFVATLVASEPSFPDLGDMHTVNETGQDAGRYLYRTHETGSNGSVSVTDLETGVTRVLAQRSDWERFDGIAWTPWGTILASEEVAPAGPGLTDPAFPAATGGMVYEINPRTGDAVVRPSVGSKAHEGMRFDQKGNLYSISERTPGYIYKLVPDHKGDLGSGQLYVLKLVEDLGDRTGWGEWVALDRTQVRINADAAADAALATGYGRPEDLETSTSTGDDQRSHDILFAAITSEDRVLAIDLDAGKGDRRGQVLVTDYVRDGVNAPADFDAPDNLALDRDGNLFITEDPGGSPPTKTAGDDVWLARFNKATPGRSQDAQRFLSITDCNAEPTGVYMSKSGRSLFVNVQHRSGDGRDGAFAIQRISDASFTAGQPQN